MSRPLDLVTAEQLLDAAVNGSNGYETQHNQLLKAIAILLFVHIKSRWHKEVSHE